MGDEMRTSMMGGHRITLDEVLAAVESVPHEHEQFDYELKLTKHAPMTAPTVVPDVGVVAHPTVAALLGWISEDEERRWLTKE